MRTLRLTHISLLGLIMLGCAGCTINIGVGDGFALGDSGAAGDEPTPGFPSR